MGARRAAAGRVRPARPPGEGHAPDRPLRAGALLITIAWVGFAIWASDPWRDDLDQAIGPIASWLIPLLLAYIPGLVIGFMAATLVVSPYHEPALEPPAAPGRRVSGRRSRC